MRLFYHNPRRHAPNYRTRPLAITGDQNAELTTLGAALARNHANSDERMTEVLNRATGIVGAWQEGSLQRAVNRRAPWTESEDALLEANQHRMAHALADELGRTVYANESRLKEIRRKARTS